MRLPRRLILLALWATLALAACSSPATAPPTQPPAGTPGETPTTTPAPAGTPTPPSGGGYY